MEGWDAVHEQGVDIIERICDQLKSPQSLSMPTVEHALSMIDALSVALDKQFEHCQAQFEKAASAAGAASGSSALARGSLGATPSLVDAAAARAVCVNLLEAELQGKDAILTALKAGLVASVAGPVAGAAPLVVLDSIIPVLPTQWQVSSSAAAAASTGVAAAVPDAMDWSAFPLAWRARWGQDRHALALALDDASAAT